MLQNGLYSDMCLSWISNLVKNHAINDIPKEVCKEIQISLFQLSSEPTNRGVLASKLEDRVSSAMYL